jgi:hypothetical protein
LNQNPTLKVLFLMRQHGVRCLLMGGQACVFYGAAEFSRDVDFAIIAETENLARLREALHSLQAEVIAVPPFDPVFLHRGHEIHFRCQAPGVEKMRVDVMSRMRGVEDFEALWQRRTTIEVENLEIDLLSLPDLVAAKKTQRSKDWPMIQRLVESSWFQNRLDPNKQGLDFWLKECRTPQILLEIAKQFPFETQVMAEKRPLLIAALQGDSQEIAFLLEQERQIEVNLDIVYWQPLREELSRIRRL